MPEEWFKHLLNCPGHGINMPAKIPVREIRRLRPLIVELKAEGRKNYTTINIRRVAEIAAEMQHLLEGWINEAKP